MPRRGHFSLFASEPYSNRQNMEMYLFVDIEVELTKEWFKSLEMISCR